MRTVGLILTLLILAYAGGYDQLHADLGLWMPTLTGFNDYLENHSAWKTTYPNAGPLLTFGYRHRWEGWFALGCDLAYWTTSTSVTDTPVLTDEGGTWYLTGNTHLHEMLFTVLPQFCLGNKDGFEFYFAPEISFVYIGITAKVEGAPTPQSAALVEDQGVLEGVGLGLGIQTGAYWKLSESLGLGGTIRYFTNDGESDFDLPEYYPEPVSIGFKGLAVSPRLEINL